MMNEKIEKINKYLKQQLWMDFELYGIIFLELGLSGRIDEMGEEKINIIFKRPYMIACTSLFTYEGGGDFVELFTGEEAYEINKRYGVTRGNYIFKLMNTHLEGLMYIIAEDIDVNIC